MAMLAGNAEWTRRSSCQLAAVGTFSGEVLELGGKALSASTKAIALAGRIHLEVLITIPDEEAHPSDLHGGREGGASLVPVHHAVSLRLHIV